jgi:hypothetical protein
LGLRISAIVVAWLVVTSPFSGAPQLPGPGVRFIDTAQHAGIGVRMINGEERTKKYIFESTGSGVALIDYDRDGYPDLFLVNGSRLDVFGSGEAPTNHLFHNNADGTFTDVTAAAGLARPTRNWSTGCAFVDYNRDGRLDLFVASYVDFDPASAPLPGSGPNCVSRGVAVFCGPRGLPAAHSVLYRNQGNGKFTDVTSAAGITKASDCYGLGVLTADFENRGWPDIYVACDSTPSLLFRNKGDGTFEERGVQAGIAYDEDGREQAGMGVSAGDYDGDGWLDIFKSNFEDDVPDLYRNERDGSFSFRTFDAKLGFNLKYLGWGGGFFDYDNDGWPDIFIANGHVYPELENQRHPESPYRQRNLLYHNLRDGRFEDVTSIAGPGLELRRSGRGVAFGDLDNDGRIDIVINNQNDPPTVLHNESANANHWISIRTVGTKSNRDGIGARITVTAGERRQTQAVTSGGSYLSQSDLRVHFGLGNASQIDNLEVQWPSGAVDKIHDVPADGFLTIEERKGLVQARRTGSEALPKAKR